jgi:hypothetical protein
MFLTIVRILGFFFLVRPVIIDVVDSLWPLISNSKIRQGDVLMIW